MNETLTDALHQILAVNAIVADPAGDFLPEGFNWLTLLLMGGVTAVAGAIMGLALNDQFGHRGGFFASTERVVSATAGIVVTFSMGMSFYIEADRAERRDSAYVQTRPACETVLSSISHGEIKRIDADGERALVRVCGRLPYYQAVNAPASTLVVASVGRDTDL